MSPHVNELPDIITSAWVINYWLIYANTTILSRLMNTSVSILKPSIVTTKLEANAAIEAANKYLLAANTQVVRDPYKKETLMRFNATVVFNGLSAKADTLLVTTTSLNLASKGFLMANGFYKDCKIAPKLAIRVASEPRISTTKVFCPSVFTIDGHEFVDLQFRVLPHLKISDIILRLPALKQINVIIHPSLNIFAMGDFTINHNLESRRISCMIVASNKMDQIIVKHAKNKKNPSDVFLISLHFVEDLASVKSDFEDQFDQQLKQLITEFVDVTEEPQGLPPHRGHLDHKVKLTGYPPRQRRNRLSAH
jgi:hypothetical protein